MFLKQKYAGLVFGFGLGNFITGTQIWISKLPERSARARVRDILRTILGKIPREIGTPGITGFKT